MPVIIKKEKCKECGFKIRSKNHKDGEYHKKGKYGNYTPPQKKKRY
jgi:hypothetical protein